MGIDQTYMVEITGDIGLLRINASQNLISAKVLQTQVNQPESIRSEHYDE